MAQGHGSGDGVRWAFEDVYACHLAAILAVVLALRGPRVGAEEVVQDAFLRAYRRWDRVGAMDRPDLWVQRVALNLATSQLRRLGAEARALGRVASRSGDGAGPAPGDGDRDFWEAVRRLPAKQARVVALRYAGDLTLAEIAEVVDVAEGTVKAHLHQARRTLATRLDPARDGGAGRAGGRSRGRTSPVVDGEEVGR